VPSKRPRSIPANDGSRENWPGGLARIGAGIFHGAVRVSLRPVREVDLDLLARKDTEIPSSPYDDFGFRGDGSLRRDFAVDGLIAKDGSRGRLVVEIEGPAMAGTVSWHAVQYGPNPGSRAFNIGLSLFAEHRGQGIGRETLRSIARYLFDHYDVGRLEGSTDVENAAMQRACEKAGFTREGVLRGAQFRQGARHDLVLYSMLRADLVR
jgi:RimJ/RimL family protein N-acetyltransferase